MGSIPGLGRSPEELNGYPLNIRALRISWTEEPGGLLCMGLQGAGHNGATNTFTFFFQEKDSFILSVRAVG